MKVVLDALRCEGYGVCASIEPDVFVLEDDDEHVRVLHDQVDEAHAAGTKNAVAECPMAALRLHE